MALRKHSLQKPQRFLVGRYEAAHRYRLDPRRLLAIGWHESRLIAKWLRNNPSLYRPYMTASQVAANYELKMDKNMKAVERYLAPSATGGFEFEVGRPPT